MISLLFSSILILFGSFMLTSQLGFRITRKYKTREPTVPIRRTTFVPHVISKTCLLEPERGPCRGNIHMYFYDPSKRNCSVFIWGGCQGNGNRFDSNEECSHSCLSQPGWKTSRPNYCLLSFDYGWCFGSDRRYYYDHLWGVCKKGVYSGCGGNKNNFYNIKMCDEVCRFGHEPIARNTVADVVKKVIIVNPKDLLEGTDKNQSSVR